MQSSSSLEQSVAVPTVMTISGMLKSESEKLRMVGTQVEAYLPYIKTKYLYAEAATHEASSEFSSVQAMETNYDVHTINTYFTNFDTEALKEDIRNSEKPILQSMFERVYSYTVDPLYLYITRTLK